MRRELGALPIALGCALLACATPEPVRELAQRTAVHTTFVSKQLKTLALQNRQLAEIRGHNIANLRTLNREVGARNALDRALLARTERTAVSTERELVGWIAETAEIFEAGRTDEAAEVRKILSGQAGIASKTKELGEVAKALATLAKKDTIAVQSVFILNYVAEVGGAVAKAQAEAEGATKDAKAMSALTKKP